MERASEELERRSRYLSNLILVQQQQQQRRGEAGDKRGRGDHQQLGGGKIKDEKGSDGLKEREDEGRRGAAAAAAAVVNGSLEKDGKEEAARIDDGRKEAERYLNIRVRASDMPPQLQKRAFRCALDVLSSMPKLDSKRLALTLKKEFDSRYGPAWHCIAGTSFGSYVTHSVGRFLYFSVDKVCILLFQTAVEPLDR